MSVQKSLWKQLSKGERGTYNVRREGKIARRDRSRTPFMKRVVDDVGKTTCKEPKTAVRQGSGSHVSSAKTHANVHVFKMLTPDV